MDHELRRKRLVARLDAVGVDALLITRLPNVRYLTGFSGSNAQLIVKSDTSLFFTDGRYTEQSRHEVPDLERRTYPAEFADAFADVCSDLGLHRVGFEPAGITYKTHQELAARAAGVELEPVGDEVERLRWVKDGEELRFIERAQEATDAGFDAILGRLGEGISERELALELERAMREAGADGLSFETIAAFGENAAEPHHEPTRRALARGDVVKLDFGAVCGGYHADMTRTVAFGDPPAELREVHALVRRAQQAGIDAVRSGVTGADADRAARHVIEQAGYAEAFSHGLGHGVGLEIHEGPDLRKISQDVLPAGAVVTVEPGVYLPGTGGVRIEDMVEVTGDGCRVIPRSTRELVVL